MGKLYTVIKDKKLNEKENYAVNSLLIKFGYYFRKYKADNKDTNARDKTFEFKRILFKKYSVKITINDSEKLTKRVYKNCNKRPSYKKKRGNYGRTKKSIRKSY